MRWNSLPVIETGMTGTPALSARKAAPPYPFQALH